MNKNNILITEYKKEVYNIPIDYCIEGRKKFADGGIVFVVNFIRDEKRKGFFVVYFKEEFKKDIYSSADLAFDSKGLGRKRNVKKYVTECLELFNPDTLTFDDEKARELLKQNEKQDDEAEQ